VKSPSTTISRRQFLSITASAGLLMAGGFGLANRAQASEPIRETRLLMGSIANLTVISGNPQQAKAAISAAFDRMEALEAVFSRFQEQSQLSQLNMMGVLADAHPAMIEVLTRAAAYGHLTDGAFDVTIEPVHRLYRDTVRRGSLPTASAVEAARQLVNYQQIEISESSVRLKQPGMAITLDGIAKGYIIDQGAAVLREHGFDNVLVELGGDMNALGQPAERPWQISIQQPNASLTEHQPLIAHLTGVALATSGDYLNTFTADHRLHHILDPQSGISPLELTSASVIAPTACDADALATSLVVMGSERGIALADQLKDIEALVITKRGDIHKTAGFPINPV
jgi:thiamine biosynthesis lipoprotein